MQSNWQDVIESFQKYKNIKLEYWLNENLFTLNWWILFVTTIIVFIVWIFLLDKKRILEIITYGLMVELIATFGDTIGSALFLWEYPYSITPLVEMAEIHKVMMPIIYMTIYQYFRKWKPFLIAAAINALIFAFILEPLLVWLGIYKLIHWKYIYSLVPYFAIAVLLKWIIIKFKQLDKNYQ